MSTPVTVFASSVWFTRLGYAGLLPFVGMALLLWVLPEPDLQIWVATAMASYGALIVSFLGGIHWGAAWHTDGAHRHAIWGIVPSLLGWLGVLMPPYAGLPWLGIVLLLCYAVDRKRYPELGLSAWLTLRFRLSAVAALSCFVAAGAV